MTKRLLTVGTLCAFQAMGGALVYSNDFSTRSSRAIPTGRWHEMPYHAGSLMQNYNNTAGFSPWNPWETESLSQDEWAKAFYGTAANAYGSGNGPSAEVTGGANPCVCFSAETSSKTFALHPLHNEFSNGVLRIRCDIRAPRTMADGATVRVRPVFKPQLDPNWDTASVPYFTAFGSTQNGTTSQFRPFFLSGNGSGGGAEAVWPAAPFSTTELAWYRYEADLDLDAGKFSGRVWKKGTTQPELNDSDGTPDFSFSGKTANYKITAANGPIAGIGFQVAGVKTGTGTDFDVELAPLYDNLSVAWKAPGESEFALCYANDFSVRRYRSIEPAGTAGFDYARESVVSEQSYAYSTGTYIVPLNNDQLTRQPVGLDGWRRLNNFNKSNTAFYIVPGDEGDGAGTKLRCSTATAFGCIAQTLGETIASGKVRLSVDFRTPDKWYHDSRFLHVGLGSSGHYDSTDGGGSTRICRAGVFGSSNTDFKFCYYDGTTKVEGDAAKADTWYRAVMTADLDLRTYSGAIYECGSKSKSLNWDETTTTPVLSFGDAKFVYDLSDIAAFSLMAYGPGDAANGDAGLIFFDNIRVWKDAGTADELEIYRNPFTTRVRKFAPQTRGTLVGKLNLDEGQDHWMRRGIGQGGVYITSGENPCVAAYGNADYSNCIHPLGAKLFKGKVMAQADLRPPRLWTWEAVRQALVCLGNDSYLQGARNATESFTKKRALAFGFGDANGTADAKTGLYADVSIRYQDGADAKFSAVKVDVSHWYRFRAEIDTDAGTYALKVYDMGTDHPTSDSADGSCVATVDSASLDADASEGLAAIALYSYGMASVEPGKADDPGCALYDNLRVWKDPTGLSVIVR